MKNRLNSIQLHKRKLKIVQTPSKGHKYTNLRAGQYLTHAHSYRRLFRIYWRSPAWQSRWVTERGKPASQKSFIAEASAKQCIKCQLNTTHVGAVCWEPQSCFPTTCAGKADHGFGVCVPLALSLSFENSELNCSTA